VVRDNLVAVRRGYTEVFELPAEMMAGAELVA